MSERSIFFRIFYLCLSLIFSTSHVCTADGMQGWIISMAKAVGDIVLKTVGAGILGGQLYDYQNEQRLFDGWNRGRRNAPVTISTGTARDQGRRGLESSDQSYEYTQEGIELSFSDSYKNESPVQRAAREEMEQQKHDETRRYYREQSRKMGITAREMGQYSQEGLSKEEARCNQIIADRRAEIAQKSVANRYYTAEQNKEMFKDHIRSANNVIEDYTERLKDIQQEKIRRQSVTTVTQATTIIPTSQTASITSTEKISTVSAEEKPLCNVIKVRELQLEKWKSSLWPIDWLVSTSAADEHRKETEGEKQKLDALQAKKWESAKERYYQFEGEKQQENSKKITEYRNGGDTGGGDKDPKKDPIDPVKAGVGTGIVRETRKNNQEHHEASSKTGHRELPKPQQSPEHIPMERINPELNKPYHESGILPTFSNDPNRAHHIWDDRRGHFNVETEKSKQAMLEVIMDPANHIGQNKAGNQVYAGPSKICDGQQVYVQTRNGEVVDAGINKTEWTREQILTGKRPTAAKDDPSQFWSVVGFGGGIAAELSVSNAEAVEIKGKLNVQQSMTALITNMSSLDFNLPDAPADVQPHFTTQIHVQLLSGGLDVSKIDTYDLRKYPICADSNKALFSLSLATLAILNKAFSTSTLKTSDNKSSMPSLPKTFAFIRKLTLPVSSSKPSSISNYKPGNFPYYKPTRSSGGYKQLSLQKKLKGSDDKRRT